MPLHDPYLFVFFLFCCRLMADKDSIRTVLMRSRRTASPIPSQTHGGLWITSGCQLFQNSGISNCIHWFCQPPRRASCKSFNYLTSLGVRVARQWWKRGKIMDLFFVRLCVCFAVALVVFLFTLNASGTSLKIKKSKHGQGRWGNSNKSRSSNSGGGWGDGAAESAGGTPGWWISSKEARLLQRAEPPRIQIGADWFGYRDVNKDVEQD